MKKTKKSISKNAYVKALAFISFSFIPMITFASEYTTVTANPKSYHYISTNSSLNAQGSFTVRICNPTDQMIQGKYTTDLYAQEFESRESKNTSTVNIEPHDCFQTSFDSYVNVSYQATGSYKLTAIATAQGVEAQPVTVQNNGWIGVGMY